MTAKLILLSTACIVAFMCALNLNNSKFQKVCTALGIFDFIMLIIGALT